MVRDDDRPLEIDFLLIVGVFMAILGLVLFEASARRVPVNDNSIYGLSLVLVGFEAMTMGKTPFADVRRSWALLVAALGVSTLGMFACFIPGVLTNAARIAVGVALLGGGLARMLHLFIARDQARDWMRAGGVLLQMTAAAALAYALRVAAGVVLLTPGLLDQPWIWAVFLAFGASLLYAAWALRRVSMAYPPAPRPDDRFSAGRGWLDDPGLPLSLAHLLLIAISLILLGVLLVPVFLGLLPYAPDGQLGLTLVLTAIQAMALGETPLGGLKRPASMLAIGLIFAALGIVASIVPGLLTDELRILLAALNVGNGAKLLLEARRPATSRPGGLAQSPPGAGALRATVAAVGALSVVFGVAALVPALLPAPVLAVLLVLMGLALLRLVLLLRNIRPQPGSKPV